MKVALTTWRGRREMSLAEGLVPDIHSDGTIERSQDTAQAALESVARLTALLVEKKVLTLSDAKDVMQVYGLEPVE